VLGAKNDLEISQGSTNVLVYNLEYLDHVCIKKVCVIYQEMEKMCD